MSKPESIHDYLKQFKDGFLLYNRKAHTSVQDDVITEGLYRDGYLHFSEAKHRFQGDSRCIAELFKQKDPARGYLMEVDLWGETEDAWHEISIERLNDTFLTQTWALKRQNRNPPSQGEWPCFYRPAITRMITNIFGVKNAQYSAMEVVVPKYRLHFFIPVMSTETERGK